MTKDTMMDSPRPRFSKLLRRTALLVACASLTLAACRNENPADLIRSARDYQAKGEHQAAIIQLKNVVQKQPENGEARLLLGQSSLIVGDPVTAEKEFRRALEHGQPRAVVAPQLAQAMLDAGAWDKVISEFGAVTLDEPKAEAELRGRVGEAQIRGRKLNDAAESFAAALKADPTNVRAQLGRARLMALDGKFDDALATVDGIVAQNPKSPDAFMLQAELRLVKGDRAGARAAFERAVEADPLQANPRFELIALLIADGQFDAATEQVKAARAVRAGDLRLNYFEALIALSSKDFAKAREVSQQLLKRAPEHVPTLVIAGSVEFQEKQYGPAEAHLQKALLLSPQHAGAARAAGSDLSRITPARPCDGGDSAAGGPRSQDRFGHDDAGRGDLPRQRRSQGGVDLLRGRLEIEVPAAARAYPTRTDCDCQWRRPGRRP